MQNWNITKILRMNINKSLNYRQKCNKKSQMKYCHICKTQFLLNSFSNFVNNSKLKLTITFWFARDTCRNSILSTACNSVPYCIIRRNTISLIGAPKASHVALQFVSQLEITKLHHFSDSNCNCNWISIALKKV